MNFLNPDLATFVVLYLYAGLIMAEASISHRKGAALTRIEVWSFFLLLFLWAILMPAYFIWQDVVEWRARNKHRGD